jgi:hypothetical protein
LYGSTFLTTVQNLNTHAKFLMTAQFLLNRMWWLLLSLGKVDRSNPNYCYIPQLLLHTPIIATYPNYCYISQLLLHIPIIATYPNYCYISQLLLHIPINFYPQLSVAHPHTYAFVTFLQFNKMLPKWYTCSNKTSYQLQMQKFMDGTVNMCNNLKPLCDISICVWLHRIFV